MNAVLAELNAAQEMSKKVYAPKVDPDYVPNETFTSLKQSQIPNGVYEFRLLPPHETKNPSGMQMVQRIGIYKGQGNGPTGSYNLYDWVLGPISNPEMTFMNDIVKYWTNFEKTKNDRFLKLPEHLQEAVKKLKGETYFEVPALFKIDQENRPYTFDAAGQPKTVNRYYVTKSNPKNIVGKIFNMSSQSVYGRKLLDDKWKPILDEFGNDTYDGVIGALNECRTTDKQSCDSVGEAGRWLKLTVEGKGGQGFPKYSVSVSPKGGGPLSQELIDKYMSEENYPNIVNRTKYIRKDNAEVANIFRNSVLYRELVKHSDWSLD